MAFQKLKSLLCPPFTTTDFDKLNTDTYNSTNFNEIIAQQATILIYELLPGRPSEVYQRLKDSLYGTDTDNGHQFGILEQLQNGNATIFDSTGTALAKTYGLACTHEGRAKVFSATTRDTSGNIISDGTLNQFDN